MRDFCLDCCSTVDLNPERKPYIVNFLGASSGHGLMMETLADLRDQGKTIDDLRDWAEADRLRMHHWFFSADLSFYVRGGPSF